MVNNQAHKHSICSVTPETLEVLDIIEKLIRSGGASRQILGFINELRKLPATVPVVSLMAEDLEGIVKNASELSLDDLICHARTAQAAFDSGWEYLDDAFWDDEDYIGD